MDFPISSFMQPAFWVACGQIIGVNIILSGDNAVVIALACRMLPPRQRLWGMILGAGVAVFLRIIFTGIVVSLMALPFLKLVGGLALLVIAMTSALSPDSRMLIHMILPSATQNAGCCISAWNWVKNVEIVAGSRICQSQFTAYSPPAFSAVACG